MRFLISQARHRLFEMFGADRAHFSLPSRRGKPLRPHCTYMPDPGLEPGTRFRLELATAAHVGGRGNLRVRARVLVAYVRACVACMRAWVRVCMCTCCAFLCCLLMYCVFGRACVRACAGACVTPLCMVLCVWACVRAACACVPGAAVWQGGTDATEKLCRVWFARGLAAIDR